LNPILGEDFLFEKVFLNISIKSILKKISSTIAGWIEGRGLFKVKCCLGQNYYSSLSLSSLLSLLPSSISFISSSASYSTFLWIVINPKHKFTLSHFDLRAYRMTSPKQPNTKEPIVKKNTASNVVIHSSDIT
jgi:hypothetical protein